MKKIFSLLVAILVISACEEVPEWEDIEHVYYNGDVDLTFSQESDQFRALMELGYNAIDGNLVINGNFNERNLDFLDQLYVITGSVSITQNEHIAIFDNLIEIGGSLTLNSLLKFDDFPKLDSVQNIVFNDCALLSIDGFNRLQTCTSLEIKDHRGQVNSFEGFPLLQKLDFLYLNLNQRTDSEFFGLENLTFCKHVKLENVGMNALKNLESVEHCLEITGTVGSNSLASCHGTDTLLFFVTPGPANTMFANPFVSNYLDIINCQEIEDLEWTTGIDSVIQCRIINCNYLYSLDGLEFQSMLDTLVCSQNDSLRDYCSVSALDIDSLYIRFNAYNPSWEQITSGACKPGED